MYWFYLKSFILTPFRVCISPWKKKKKSAFIITPYWQAKQQQKIKDIIMPGAIVNKYQLLRSSLESRFLFLSFFVMCEKFSVMSKHWLQN